MDPRDLSRSPHTRLPQNLAGRHRCRSPSSPDQLAFPRIEDESSPLFTKPPLYSSAEKNNPIDEGRDAGGSLAEARYRGIRDVEEGQGWVNVDHCD